MTQMRYFFKIIQLQNKGLEVIRISPLTSAKSKYILNRFYSKDLISTVEEKNNQVDLVENSKNLSLLKQRQHVLLPTFNFAAYIEKSPTLQKFIQLGVKLYEIEKKPNVGEFLLRLDFNKDVKPYLIFLKDVGLAPDRFGDFISKNPLIFKESLEDLRVRINYLESKKFTPEMIANIIDKNPLWLSTPVKEIDKKLGFLQQTFKLKGDDVRKIINQVPTLASTSKIKLITNIHALKDEMALDDLSLKKLIIHYPTLLKKDEYGLIRNFDYVSEVMKVPKHLILAQPRILTCRYYLIRSRHLFLQQLGRAQYNPLLPCYISLNEFCTLSDDEFCEKVAKTPVELFDNFLKTL